MSGRNIIEYFYDGDLYCRGCHELVYEKCGIEIWGEEFRRDLVKYHGRPIFRGEELDANVHGYPPSRECCGEVFDVKTVKY